MSDEVQSFEFTCDCGRKHHVRFGRDKAERPVELDRPTYYALAWGRPVNAISGPATATPRGVFHA